METKNVYKAIAAVAAKMAKEGISKDRKNSQQGYNFRGIDDVYNALAPVIAEHNLVILPRMTGRIVTERETKNGGALFYVVVEAEFDFVSAEDGSSHTVKTFGEAMDSGDKATNKAMSAAYKYAAFQTFCIPTAGDNDADSTTHDVVAKPKTAKDGMPTNEYADWITKINDASDISIDELRAVTKDAVECAKKRGDVAAMNKLRSHGTVKAQKFEGAIA